jgi:aryl-alcohol dehydrogenase-like predicted oxidoreductase
VSAATQTRRALGCTGLHAEPFGLGAVELGMLPIDDAESTRLLNGALDAGIDLIDTAECYGTSEERIGRALAARRAEYVLVTKCGHRVEADDPADWTPELLEANIVRSLRRLRTDAVDVLLLHSCTSETLRAGVIVEKLLEIKRRGLARCVGYSGDAELLDTALELSAQTGCFDVIELSVNLCDQQPLDRQLAEAQRQGLGVLAKRPLANACWLDPAELEGYLASYAQPYARRLHAMGITPAGVGFEGDWVELAVRFAAHAPGVGCAIGGSRKLGHLQTNMEYARRGPLPEHVAAALRAAWAMAADASWEGQN